MLGGDDILFGSPANDLAYGNEGEDAFDGDLGNDSLFGGRGKDALSGEEGNDYISGGQDADIIDGGDGNDFLLGGRGNDWLISGNGDDTLIGGLGRDYLYSAGDDPDLPKIGSNLYVLQAEPGLTDINNADVILPFKVGADRIGLAGGLTASDVVLENLTNVTIVLRLDLPQSFQNFIEPGQFDGVPTVSSGTVIRVKNSSDILGFVDGVTPAQIQGSIISVQGF
ncbi:calcium-binding protein [Microcoleus sp. AT3-A2]|uniref:calcium-binding protein n=1 Tax=Microcoleus sp. AT3-A2 TaxID=2818610 RepID=UPI002FD61ECC